MSSGGIHKVCPPLSRLCRKSARFKGVASSVVPYLFWRKAAALGRVNPLPGRPIQRRGEWGAELPDGFLCRCPFERASKSNENLTRDPQYIIVCVPVLDFAAVKIRLQRFYRFEGMRHGGKLERARQKG